MEAEISQVNRELQFEVPHEPNDMFEALQEEIRLSYGNQYLFQSSINGLYGIWSNSTFAAWANQYVETYIENAAATGKIARDNGPEQSTHHVAMLDGCVLGMHAYMLVLPESVRRDIYHEWPTDIAYKLVKESDEVYTQRLSETMLELDWELDDNFNNLEPHEQQILRDVGELYGDEYSPSVRATFVRGIELSRAVIIDILKGQREEIETEST